MDRRVLILIAAAGLLAIVVGIVLIARAGDDDAATTTTADAGEKPTVEVPDGPPPDELEVEDLTEGDGEEAAAGDRLTVEYVGVDYASGEEFDSSFERPDPFQFELGAGEVIEGWDEGLEGMKVGGRRQLVIPPGLAYGKQGQPPAIGPDATLVFVIDLVEIG